MRQELSILIPVYNECCVRLVKELSRQAEAVEGLNYEIIVADDGSTDALIVAENEHINEMQNCRYVVREENVGRAVIRNFLARQARYEWLLFIDCDMTVRSEQFLTNYLLSEGESILYGGYVVGEGDGGNLRYRYEKASELHHTVEKRRMNPYRDFHTSNFMIRRELMLQFPFDERFRRYGYEDVLQGKLFRQHGIAITHIDNPLGFDTFEGNEQFLRKTEEGLRTLHEFRQELRGYNNLLTLVNGIHVGMVRSLLRCLHRLFAPLERRNLVGHQPSLIIFKLYKLGYYLTLTEND